MKTLGEIAADLATKGAANIKLDARMCSGCAFKKGTPANGETEALGNAMECLLTDRMDFGCHQNRDRLCVGYLYAKHADE